MKWKSMKSMKKTGNTKKTLIKFTKIAQEFSHLYALGRIKFESYNQLRNTPEEKITQTYRDWQKMVQSREMKGQREPCYMEEYRFFELALLGQKLEISDPWERDESSDDEEEQEEEETNKEYSRKRRKECKDKDREYKYMNKDEIERKYGMTLEQACAMISKRREESQEQLNRSIMENLWKK
ncbi:MAG: hypothetical protein Ta2E_10170 [Mycoplasmoidaceae bacterium]|nr:MAG: hypothetical protein Ta2E_10170 [Mycoplasmoidaceae bacterium]